MYLEIDASGIVVQLKIKGYTPSWKENWDSQWCRCDYTFRSGDWLHYHGEDDEVLLSCEVEALEKTLTKLLNDELEEVKEIRCIEPDFMFKMQPKRDLRNDPSYTYIRPGYEIADIYMEWKVYFWHVGLTDNFLTVTLRRDEIIRFRDYLSQIINAAKVANTTEKPEGR